jgi:hypothetical protein
MKDALSTDEQGRQARILRVREQIGTKLDEISRLYKDRVVCTLIVRAVDYPGGERDTVMTDEPEIEKAIAALRKLLRDPNAEHYDDTSRANV